MLTSLLIALVTAFIIFILAIVRAGRDDIDDEHWAGGEWVNPQDQDNTK